MSFENRSAPEEFGVLRLRRPFQPPGALASPSVLGALPTDSRSLLLADSPGLLLGLTFGPLPRGSLSSSICLSA